MSEPDESAAVSTRRSPRLNREPRELSWQVFLLFVLVGSLYLAVLPWIQLAFVLVPHRNRLVLLWVWFLAGQALYFSYTAVKSAYLMYEARSPAQWREGLAFVFGTLAVSLSGTLGGFAQTYYVLFGGSPHDFQPALTPMGAAFFTFGTFTTAGSGINAKSGGAQALTIAQMVVDGFIVLVTISYVVASARPRWSSELPPQTADNPPVSEPDSDQ
jgi:hypothetical protein